MEFNKNFKRSAVKIPGVNSDISSDESMMEDIPRPKIHKISRAHTINNNNNIAKNNDVGGNEDEEYVPKCLSETTSSYNVDSYVPYQKSPTYDCTTNNTNNNAAVAVDKFNVRPKSPVMPPPQVTSKTMSSSASERSEQKSTKISKRRASKMEMQQQQVPHPVVNIEDDIVYITMFQKNTYDVNLQISPKYFKDIMPIFNKGVRTDLYVQLEKSDTIWCNVVIKSTDGLKSRLAIYKIINIDDKIIPNLNVGMNNVIAFKESILSSKSDKNYKIYEESGVICVGGPDDLSNKDLYINARMEIKKNITYVFNTSLNAIFARQYINVQNEFYTCSLNSRDDNKYLLCLVITAMDNHIIENGVKLMHNINYNNNKN